MKQIVIKATDSNAIPTFEEFCRKCGKTMTLAGVSEEEQKALYEVMANLCKEPDGDGNGISS